jgi:hypothetical protein
MPFDNAGLITGIALVNTNKTTPAQIAVTIRNEKGVSILTDLLLIPSNGHVSLDTTAKWTLTAGKRGILDFKLSTPDIPGLGFRFNGAAFAAIPVTVVPYSTTGPARPGEYERESNDLRDPIGRWVSKFNLDDDVCLASMYPYVLVKAESVGAVTSCGFLDTDKASVRERGQRNDLLESPRDLSPAPGANQGNADRQLTSNRSVTVAHRYISDYPGCDCV